MDHQNNPEAAFVARARARLAAAAREVEMLESAVNLAFFRLAAVTELLGRLEEGSRKPGAGKAEQAASSLDQCARERARQARRHNATAPTAN